MQREPGRRFGDYMVLKRKHRFVVTITFDKGMTKRDAQSHLLEELEHVLFYNTAKVQDFDMVVKVEQFTLGEARLRARIRKALK